PALGRFHQPDAITDLLPGISSFSFAFNNPVYFNDPTGLAPSDTAAYSGQCPGEKEPNWAFNSSPGSFGGGGGGGSFVGGGGDGGGSQARPAGRAPGGGGVRPGAGRGGNNRREEFMRRQLEREQQQRLRELFGQGVKARTRRQYISEPGASGLPMEEMYDLNDFSIPIDNAERLKRLNEFLGRKAGKEDEGPLTTLYWIEVLNPGYYQCYSCEGYPGGSNDAEHTVTNSATKYPLIKLKAGDTWKFGITVESPLQVRYEKDPDPYVIEQIQRGNFVMRKITVGPRTLMRMKEKVLIAMYPHHKDNLERYKRTGVWLPRPPGNKQDN
ncbi:MAG: hypothetical protein MUC97_13720, partial [Bernardetiaceae bacterium]|nr:hypothetical protein [Bernardetiaceae bacterium]